jgi:hypothetical protein
MGLMFSCVPLRLAVLVDQRSIYNNLFQCLVKMSRFNPSVRQFNTVAEVTGNSFLILL